MPKSKGSQGSKGRVLLEVVLSNEVLPPLPSFVPPPARKPETVAIVYQPRVRARISHGSRHSGQRQGRHLCSSDSSTLGRCRPTLLAAAKKHRRSNGWRLKG